MGAKKKNKGKGAKGKGGDDDEINPADMNLVLKAQVESLKQRLVLEQEMRDKSLSKEHEIRANEADMSKELDEHRTKTADIVQKMTGIYRSMQRQLDDQIAKQEEQKKEQEDEMKSLKDEIA